MPVIEKHDLGDVIEVQRIRMLIRHDKSSREFFETMLRLINKSLNGKAIYDNLSEGDTEVSELSESEDEGSLSDLE